ncbi:MAG: DUF2095 family protein, partial [Promethearchaeota archaeon]
PRESTKPIVKKQNGLTIDYNKNEFNDNFPHLLNEITGKSKFIKIESIQTTLNTDQFDSNRNHPRELVNPSAIDFIRRCTTNEEAIKILDFLVKRKELSKTDYDSYKNQILIEDGLQNFIEKHGGFKSPGYYEKKFRNLEKEKPNQNQIED